MKRLPTWIKDADRDRVVLLINYLESQGFAFGDVNPESATYIKGTVTREPDTAVVWLHKPPTPSQFVRPDGGDHPGEVFTVLRKAKQWVEDDT